MVFDAHANGDGQWHCPFSPEWLKMMKRAVNVVKHGREQERRPPGKDIDFLKEPQDARGVPLWWCKEYEKRHKDWPTECRATWDYSSIPEVVVTNGIYDWPL